MFSGPSSISTKQKSKPELRKIVEKSKLGSRCHAYAGRHDGNEAETVAGDRGLLLVFILNLQRSVSPFWIEAYLWADGAWNTFVDHYERMEIDIYLLTILLFKTFFSAYYANRPNFPKFWSLTSMHNVLCENHYDGE